jgi:hypothetical protein
MDTSLIYHFLIIVPNRYSTTPMEYFLKSFKIVQEDKKLNENNILMKNKGGSKKRERVLI